MTVPARRILDFTESTTDQSGEDIRCHVRSRLERLVATLKAGSTRIRVEAE